MTTSERVVGTDGRRGATRQRGPSPWLGTAARLLLASVLGYAGLAKLGDLAQAARTVALYQLVPAGWAQTVGNTLPFLEIALALLLLLGLATRGAGAVTAALLTLYLAAVVSVWARGLSIDCGCFGGSGTVSGGAERGYLVDIIRDTALLAASLVLVLRPQTRYALDRLVLEVKEP